MSINDHSDYEAVIIWDAINKFVFGRQKVSLLAES